MSLAAPSTRCTHASLHTTSSASAASSSFCGSAKRSKGAMGDTPPVTAPFAPPAATFPNSKARQRSDSATAAARARQDTSHSSSRGVME